MDATHSELTGEQTQRLFALALVLLTVRRGSPPRAVANELAKGPPRAWFGLSRPAWKKLAVAEEEPALKLVLEELIHRMPWAEREERKTEAILMGGVFAEAGECGRDNLPCGLCDDCIGDAVFHELGKMVQQWELSQL